MWGAGHLELLDQDAMHCSSPFEFPHIAWPACVCMCVHVCACACVLLSPK